MKYWRLAGEICPVCRERETAICRQKNLVYRYSCRICKDGGKDVAYIGMTCRLLGYRASEHEANLNKRLPESPAWRHIKDCHPDMEGAEDLPSLFKWDVLRRCRTAFERVVSEVVLIQESVDRQEETNLNSREEWGAYTVPELSLKEVEDRRKLLRKNEDEGSSGREDETGVVGKKM